MRGGPERKGAAMGGDALQVGRTGGVFVEQLAWQIDSLFMNRFVPTLCCELCI